MLTTLSLLALGFLLGMRHATDPDHVVAVTTIVSQQRSVARAAGIGALWGVGHTATIVLVGGAILLFRVAVPPRLGLAMEFAVAVMLVLLGARNLAGGARAAAAALSPVRPVVVGFVHGRPGPRRRHRVPARLRRRDGCGDDAHHGRDRGPVGVRRHARQRRAALRPARGRCRERLLRTLPRPPGGCRRRTLCGDSALDAAVVGRLA
jgi:ABC-type nickel/cobalt efflux system permease component RcnA